MNIAQSVQDRINTMPEGQIFGYSQLASYKSSSSAVIKAVSRLVASRSLTRLSKGKFYVPKKGILGDRKPSDNELIREALYKDGQLRGYVTGPALYNQLGLTTQIPKTITIASNGARLEKSFGTIRIKQITARMPIKEKEIPLLQCLDALKDIKRILGSEINSSLMIMTDYIEKLSVKDQQNMTKLALEYYSPQVRALLGLTFSRLKLPVPRKLSTSLNPVTKFKLDLNSSLWPNAKDWNIR